jgi:hypothetical protein
MPGTDSEKIAVFFIPMVPTVGKSKKQAGEQMNLLHDTPPHEILQRINGDASCISIVTGM